MKEQLHDGLDIHKEQIIGGGSTDSYPLIQPLEN
jgi:hypothetical protein